jgi:hypothetical protein
VRRAAYTSTWTDRPSAGTSSSRNVGRRFQIEAGSLREYLYERFASKDDTLRRDPAEDGADAGQPPDAAEDGSLSLDRATSADEALAAIFDGWIERDLDVELEAVARRVEADFATCWAQLIALDTVVEEAVEGFQEAAVIPESMRQVMAAIRSRLEALRDDERGGLASLPLPLVDEASLQELRECVARDARLYL